jgi:hypothetical protein
LALLLLLLEPNADLPELFELRWPAQLDFEFLLELLGSPFLEFLQLVGQLSCLPFEGGQEVALHVHGLALDRLQFPEEVLGLIPSHFEGRLAEVDGKNSLSLLRAEEAEPGFLLSLPHFPPNLLDQGLSDGGQLIIESPLLLGQPSEEYGEGGDFDALADLMLVSASLA